MGRRRWGYALSLLIILPGIVTLILNGAAGRGALDWGIDFTGGNFFQWQLQQPFEVGDVRQIVDRFATGQSVIQKSGQEVLVRTRPLPAGTKQALLDAMKARFGSVTVLREDEVGPKIGRELRTIALVAVIVGLALQVIYIGIRFKSIRYAVAADVALLHDLLVVTGVFALTRKEVNSSFVAVLLTVVGYSINDTIVIFDRIRENLAQRTREPFDRLVNRSILEALIRSINTALTTIHPRHRGRLSLRRVDHPRFRVRTDGRHLHRRLLLHPQRQPYPGRLASVERATPPSRSRYRVPGHRSARRPAGQEGIAAPKANRLSGV